MKNLSQKCQELLKRNPDSYKGDFGHVLIIGGDYGMGGAVIMAAEAAYRAGEGKVSVLTRPEHIAPLLERLPNAMYVIFNEDAQNQSFVKSNNAQSLPQNYFNDKSVIAIGPGLGKSPWSHQLLDMVMHSNLPKIIDADALNLIAEDEKDFDFKNSILTPHSGEAARLLGISIAEIKQDREDAIKKLHQKYGATIVLKGKGSLILGEKKDGDDNKDRSKIKIEKCEYGNAGMAVAGMGDVLSGLIAGLVAQKIAPKTAAILGVNIHAYAADLVAKKQGEVGMIPTDLLNYFPLIINGV